MPEKLSLGLRPVEGGPADFSGSTSARRPASRQGDGKAGKKASGLLMVDGVLYLWVRNAGNAQLAWSADHGRTWTWADWKFTTSFGCPTFLNFGKNYAGARDEYVYVYSHDSDSAYEPADRMVLARVPKGRISEPGRLRVLRGLDAGRQPAWTARHRPSAARSSRTRGGATAPGQLQRRPEALPAGARPAGGDARRPRGLRHLRRAGAVGAVDDGLLHRGLGRRRRARRAASRPSG